MHMTECLTHVFGFTNSVGNITDIQLPNINSRLEPTFHYRYHSSEQVRQRHCRPTPGVTRPSITSSSCSNFEDVSRYSFASFLQGSPDTADEQQVRRMATPEVAVGVSKAPKDRQTRMAPYLWWLLHLADTATIPYCTMRAAVICDHAGKHAALLCAYRQLMAADRASRFPGNHDSCYEVEVNLTCVSWRSLSLRARTGEGDDNDYVSEGEDDRGGDSLFRGQADLQFSFPTARRAKRFVQVHQIV
ncbi:hypothetical protein DFH94DRAFT_267842 [Russula ochroleuca]|uniref:Uncharacterized protein n=1 Tax=Russula ochroleuca TaxID=152965 RepID=A0A9P5TD83_9AGAM|nr:hypothetical protein DFH94DRAFT_267842 [Russula ochroleuca]